MQILSAASALLAAGIASALGGSIFIAAFSAGVLFGSLRPDGHERATQFVDEGGELFNAVTFIVFGAIILGPALKEMTWQIVLYGALSLTVVRMVPVALALSGTGARRPTLAFLGWFGPRGLASIVFAVILLDDSNLPHLQPVLLAITATIALSVYAHGLTARPLTERYVRWWTSTHARTDPKWRASPHLSSHGAHARYSECHTKPIDPSHPSHQLSVKPGPLQSAAAQPLMSQEAAGMRWFPCRSAKVLLFGARRSSEYRRLATCMRVIAVLVDHELPETAVWVRSPKVREVEGEHGEALMLCDSHNRRVGVAKVKIRKHGIDLHCTAQKPRRNTHDRMLARRR